MSGPSLWCGRTLLRIMVGLLYMEDGLAKILDVPLLNGGEFAIVYCFMFLDLGIAGGGQWSLDRFVRPHPDPPYRRSGPEQQLSRAHASEATFIPIAASPPTSCWRTWGAAREILAE